MHAQNPSNQEIGNEGREIESSRSSSVTPIVQDQPGLSEVLFLNELMRKKIQGQFYSIITLILYFFQSGVFGSIYFFLTFYFVV